ncbi:hypothetical protein [Streptomyces collinus]|uniref:hypothetical protein n=1 Tax=Streptomyces collinus TaxID=42684 RepID=UPI0037F44867
MIGIEIAAGYVFAWAVRKVRRAAPRADEEVDRAVDTAMDHFHDLVSRMLGADPALDEAVEEARGGAAELSDLTHQRLVLSLMAAIKRAPTFESELAQAVTALQEAGAGVPSRTVTAKGVRSVAVGGSAGLVVTGDRIGLPGAVPVVPGEDSRPSIQHSDVQASGERAVAVAEDAAQIITGDGAGS